VAADALELADAYNTLGLVLTRVDALDEARRYLDKALAIRLAKQGAEHLDVAIAIQNLGSLAMRAGQLREAEAQFRRALELKRRLLGAQNPSVLTSMQSLAVVLAAQHRVDAAEALLRELVAQRRAVHGPQSATVASALNELASVLQDGGRSAEAIAAYREALALHEQLQGRGSVSVAVNINNLATALEDLGDPAAESQYRESLAIRQAALKPEDLSLARARHNLGRWLLRAGRLAEAGPLLAQAATVRRTRLPAGHMDRIDSELTLAELALAEGQPAEAEHSLAAAATHEAQLRPLRRVALWRAQALLARRQGQLDAALAKQNAALHLALANVGPSHPVLLRLRVELAELAAQTTGQAELQRQVLRELAPALVQQHADSALRRRALALQTPDKP